MAETATVPVKAENGHVRKREPLEMFEALQDEMTRLWSQTWPFGGMPFSRRMGQLFQAPAIWSPRVDVFEKDNSLVVKAELPGTRREDIEVTLDRGDLMLRGERKAESEVKEEHYYRMERSYGSFYRRLPLGFDADPTKIVATFVDGVLEVRIPKPTEVETKAQKIQVS